jgi:hypothetical protein
MATARRTRLTPHSRCRAARATATLFHFFIPGGVHHPIPNRRVSVRSYTKRLRHAGYVVKTYHPAPLGASDPTEGGSLFHRNVRYFLPPDNDVDYLAKTLKPDQGELVHAAALCHRAHWGYLRCLKALTINPPKAVGSDIQEKFGGKRGSTLALFDGVGV